MSRMHLSLKLLRPTVKEGMYLQENTLYDIDPKVTQNVAKYPTHHAPEEFEVAMSKGLGGYAFTRKYIIQWP